MLHCSKCTCNAGILAYTCSNVAAQQIGVTLTPCSSTTSANQFNGDMNMLTAEQVLASQKASLETLFGLTHKAFEGVEKLVELNVQASKAALSESANHTQAMLSVKDAQELMALQAGLMQPWLKKPLPTAATCMTSPAARPPNSARPWKPKPQRCKPS
jgi:hypothetical protein